VVAAICQDFFSWSFLVLAVAFFPAALSAVCNIILLCGCEVDVGGAARATTPQKKHFFKPSALAAWFALLGRNCGGIHAEAFLKEFHISEVFCHGRVSVCVTENLDCR